MPWCIWTLALNGSALGDLINGRRRPGRRVGVGRGDAVDRAGDQLSNPTAAWPPSTTARPRRGDRAGDWTPAPRVRTRASPRPSGRSASASATARSALDSDEARGRRPRQPRSPSRSRATRPRTGCTSINPLAKTSVAVAGKLDLNLPVTFLGEPVHGHREHHVTRPGRSRTSPLPDFSGAANGGSFNLGQQFGRAVVDGVAGAFDRLNQAVQSARRRAAAGRAAARERGPLHRRPERPRAAGPSVAGDRPEDRLGRPAGAVLGRSGRGAELAQAGRPHQRRDGERRRRGGPDPSQITSSTDTVTFHLQLGQSLGLYQDPQNPLKFDIGLPALGLSLSGGVDAQAWFRLRHRIRREQDPGILLRHLGARQGPRHRQRAGDCRGCSPSWRSIDASLGGLAATGRLGFFQVTASDSTADPSHVTATLGVDLRDPSGTAG